MYKKSIVESDVNLFPYVTTNIQHVLPIFVDFSRSEVSDRTAFWSVLLLGFFSRQLTYLYIERSGNKKEYVNIGIEMVYIYIYIYIYPPIFFYYISFPILSNSAFPYFSYCINFQKLSKLKKKYTLHKQATPDDGLWRVRKRSGQFWEIHLPIPTWN